jgi:LmbE family N-acetylglucosaminyl deacetylase
MIKSLSNTLRRKGRAWKRAGEFPILLPHFSIEDEGLVGPLGEKYALTREELAGMRLCDGTRKLSEIPISGGRMMELYDEGKVVLWRSAVGARVPEEQVDTIVVSPHPDDAALSAAHVLLASHGESVMVVDVFSKTAWWRLSDSAGDLDEIQRVRFAEEQLVMRMAQAKLRVLGLPEALLRGHEMGEIFSCAIGEKDREVAGKIREATAAIAREHPHAKWYLPMGVGGHVDHRIVREVVGEVLRGAGIREVFGYEEMFYAAEVKEPLSGGEKRAVGMKWKKELCRVYWSQFTAGRLKMLEEYAEKMGEGEAVERVWKLGS